MTYEEKKTGGFKCAGEFFAAVRKACDGERVDNRLDVLHKAALTEGTDSGGGFLVPEQWAKPIYTASMESSIVRPRAQILPMTSDTGHVLVAQDSNRGTNIFGGVVLTWVAEGADHVANAAAPTIARVGLTAHEAVASM